MRHHANIVLSNLVKWPAHWISLGEVSIGRLIGPVDPSAEATFA
jgi:hypothetical protein